MPQLLAFGVVDADGGNSVPAGGQLVSVVVLSASGLVAYGQRRTW